jgi:hypothetical protein
MSQAIVEPVAAAAVPSRNRPRNDVITAPLNGVAITAAHVSIVSAAVFVALLSLLHAVKPEISPSWRFISEYQIGRHGWLMTAAFLSLMVAASGILVAVRSQIRTVGGYIGLGLLLLSTVGFALAAVFTSDPITATTPSRGGQIHSLGAMLGGNIAYAALLIGWSLARNKAWSSMRRALLWTTSIACIGLAASVYMAVLIGQAQGNLGPDVLVGWPNRVLILAYDLWMLSLAGCAVRVHQRAGRAN